MRIMALLILMVGIFGAGMIEPQAQGATQTAVPDDSNIVFSSNVYIRAVRQINATDDYKVVQVGDQWFIENALNGQRTLLPENFTGTYGSMVFKAPDPRYLLIKTFSIVQFYSYNLSTRKILYLGQPTVNDDGFHGILEDRITTFGWADAHQFVMTFRSMPEWSFTYAVIGDVTQENSVQIALTSMRLPVHFYLNPPRLEKWDTPFNPIETQDAPLIFDQQGNLDCLQTVYDIRAKTTQVRHFKAYCYPTILRSTGVAYFAAQQESIFGDYSANMFSPFDDARSVIIRFDPKTSTSQILYSGVFDRLTWVSADEKTALVVKHVQGSNEPATYLMIDLTEQKIIKSFEVDGSFTGDALDDGKLLLVRDIPGDNVSPGYRQLFILFDPKTTAQKPLFELKNINVYSIRKIEGSVITIEIGIRQAAFNGFPGVTQYEIELK